MSVEIAWLNIKVSLTNEITLFFSSWFFRRKARLVLTDVLKTDAGITYLERMKRSYKSGVREQMSTQRDGGCSKEKASLTRSGQDELKWEHRSPTPKHSQKSTASTHTK